MKSDLLRWKFIKLLLTHSIYLGLTPVKSLGELQVWKFCNCLILKAILFLSTALFLHLCHVLKTKLPPFSLADEQPIKKRGTDLQSCRHRCISQPTTASHPLSPLAAFCVLCSLLCGMLATGPADTAPMTNGVSASASSSLSDTGQPEVVWNLRQSLDAARIDALGAPAASVRCWLAELRCHTEPECSHVLQSKSIVPSAQAAAAATSGANRISPSGKRTQEHIAERNRAKEHWVIEDDS